MVRKILEISLAISKNNLDAFRKASRGMNQSMTYKMSNVVKKVVKTHKGSMKITTAFINLLDNIGSFERDKIPLSTMRRLYQKNFISHSVYTSSELSYKPQTGINLKKADYQRHAELKVRECKRRRCTKNMLLLREETLRSLKTKSSLNL